MIHNRFPGLNIALGSAYAGFRDDLNTNGKDSKGMTQAIKRAFPSIKDDEKPQLLSETTGTGTTSGDGDYTSSSLTPEEAKKARAREAKQRKQDKRLKPPKEKRFKYVKII